MHQQEPASSAERAELGPRVKPGDDNYEFMR